MPNLIEDRSLRDKMRVFKDRKEAGWFLAQRLSGYKDVNGIVLGIPSGGVPVAAEIAKVLGLSLDVIIVRKIQLPDNTEAGFGAVGPDGEVSLNTNLISQLHLTQEEVERQIQITVDTIKRRNELFREGRQFPLLKDKVVIIVDDGLASGYTMLSAVDFIKRRKPEKVVVAVPTAPKETVDLILPWVDELVCLNVRSGFTFAVADAYENWYDLEEEEVVSILRSFHIG
ncbi:MAG: phosphoribosyltransferase [Planctomycetes bacterium]|uniref:phosphoribosyltransferase n=1 Tax=Candidatus Wunengus californicus TaxID=3367619 RepID=UPI00402596A4|nr:phosphoribosyltransferase [Planctomycetota bacterium]